MHLVAPPPGEVSDLIQQTIKRVVTVPTSSIRRGASRHQILRHIREFWDALPATLSAGELVEISGALSTYGPMLVGSPRRKRDFHRDFRRALPDIEKQKGRTFIDAWLAYSAGQLVVRLDPNSTPLVYMGLYHSIVRNSIPLFIRKEYFDATVAPLFGDPSAPNVVEANVTGVITPIQASFTQDYIDRIGVKGMAELKTLEPAFGLRIDGPDTSTTVEYAGEGRYLDGDIWVAVSLDGEEHWVTRFVDLSDPTDVSGQQKALRDDVREFYEGGVLLAEFDQIERAFEGFQAVDPKDVIQRLKTQG